MINKLFRQKIFALKNHTRYNFASLKDLLDENEFVEIKSEKSKILGRKYLIQKEKAETKQLNLEPVFDKKEQKEKFTLGDLKKTHQKYMNKLGFSFEEREQQTVVAEQLGQPMNYVDTFYSQKYKQRQQTLQLKQRIKAMKQQQQIDAQQLETLSLKKEQQKIEDISDLKQSRTGQHIQQSLDTINKQIHTNKQELEEYLSGEQLVNTADIPLEVYAELMNEIEHMKDQVAVAYEHIIEGREEEEEGEQEVEEWRNLGEIQEQVEKHAFMEEEEDSIKMYPGSAKGLEPHHDPINYIDWYQKNIPEDYKQSLFPDEEQEEEDEDGQLVEYGQEHQQELLVLNGASQTLDNPNSLKNILTTNIYEQLADEEQPIQLQNFQQENTLNVVPDQYPLEMNACYDYFERWALFRVYPQLKWFQQLWQIVQQNEHHQQHSQQPFDPNAQELQLYSVYTYYQLLPAFARQHPVVQNTANCLEYTKNNMSYQDKMKALNFAATFALQLDDYTISAVKNVMYTEDCALNKKEQYLLDKWTHETSEELFIRNEQLFLDKAKKVDLESGMEEVGEWQQPEYLKPEDIEEPLNTLTYLYYDNDDGFWDHYIQYKENLYSKADVIYSRPYFKH